MTKVLMPMPVSRAARLVAVSREAQNQSVTAIRQSLLLLRQPIYPASRPGQVWEKRPLSPAGPVKC